METTKEEMMMLLRELQKPRHLPIVPAKPQPPKADNEN